ncbi:RNA 2'-phosphotransferase [Taibaiella koreensis]|uniref:RNA 2'-phosphotransferase n=1 Tax=Taibaiella koreensis TaxID=1268548 RepID=UPI000E59EF94|nr:RNA 2'-phosphotransferase [Taibaiella koreensis]
METKQLKTISKFLSLVLRHSPETIGLQLDAEGWANVQELIGKTARGHHPLTLSLLEQIVADNDKQRFAFSDDRQLIRASQGHSVMIDLKLDPQPPPEYLYHGTVGQNLEAIRAGGLNKMSRRHVHLSRDRELAQQVGGRRGKPVVLRIRAGLMDQDGISFYLSDNGVWLTDHVPVQYIEF